MLVQLLAAFRSDGFSGTIRGMEKEDFDIDSLAAFLHLMPPQVLRMAERGRLPGRKVAGAWRFSRPEIHHWLEDRIGVSDEEELIEVEDVLDRDDPAQEQPPSIAKLIPEGGMAVPLKARTQPKVITAMTNLAMETGMLWDPAKMAEAVRARENLHPTALDNGVAMLHPRRPLPGILAEAVIALGRTHQGIPFGGGCLSDIFFLICSTNDREHLRILARLSRLVGDAEFISALRDSEDVRDMRAAIVQFESEL